MVIPSVLSVREARQGLTKLIHRLSKSNAEPVFVGSHRKPEVVVMSVKHYEKLLAAADKQALENAVASARLEGLEPTVTEIELMTKVAAGELTADEAVAIALATQRSTKSA